MPSNSVEGRTTQHLDASGQSRCATAADSAVDTADARRSSRWRHGAPTALAISQRPRQTGRPEAWMPRSAASSPSLWLAPATGRRTARLIPWTRILLVYSLGGEGDV